MSYNLKALQQYQKVDVGATIQNASPHKLISMLLDGALTALARSKGMIERHDVEGRTQQLNKASDIIVGLRSSLDLEQGGEIAANLDNLYSYMLSRLMLANRNNDVAAVSEVSSLLTEIKQGWEDMPDTAKS